MRKLFMGVFIFVIASYSAAAWAGFFDETVDYVDLAQISPAGLETLKDTEFEVFLANVKLAEAKGALKMAQGALETARRVLDTKSLDLKAAQAESKAAKATQDSKRMNAAEALLRHAREDSNTAMMLVDWKKAELKAQKAGVDKAKRAVALAEAKRELARVSRLAAEKASSADKYAVPKFEINLKKREEAYRKADGKVKLLTAEAQRLKTEFEKLTNPKRDTE